MGTMSGSIAKALMQDQPLDMKAKKTSSFGASKTSLLTSVMQTRRRASDYEKGIIELPPSDLTI